MNVDILFEAEGRSKDISELSIAYDGDLSRDDTEKENTKEMEIGKKSEIYLAKKYYDKKEEQENGNKDTDGKNAKKKRKLCQICNKSFSIFTIKVHERSHNDFSCKCDVCGKQFRELRGLEKHKTDWHVESSRFLCEICGIPFNHLTRMRKHIENHSDDRKFCCAHCGSTFKQRKYLATHMLVHVGEKTHECQICMKSFVRKAALKAHCITHQKEKPFKCELCDKGFASAFNLKKHEFIHKGLKPYSCETCDAAFTEQGNMKKHMQVHIDKSDESDY